MLTTIDLNPVASDHYLDEDFGFSYKPTPVAEDSSSQGFSCEGQPTSIKQEHFSQPVLPATDQDCVREFFQYSLPTFKRHRDHVDSRSTRAPAYYDRHLDEHLRLMRVVYLPSFSSDLGLIADQALDDSVAHNTLPSTTAPKTAFPNPEALERALDSSLHSQITDEEPLKETYRHAIASQCLLVASTLEFRLPVWSTGHLRYLTQRPKNEGNAIADGYFKIVDFADPAIPPLSKVHLKTIEDFPHLGIWEFKNLLAGSIQVFEAVREHARMEKFSWIGCEAGSFCTLQHPTASDKPLRCWAKTGPDATKPVCASVSSPSHLLPPRPAHDVTPTDMTHGTYMIQQVWAEMVKNDTTFACLCAGRYEMYFQRDREKKTLYISDIIETALPGHARLLIGLFIAMLRDAKDRSIQLSGSSRDTWVTTNPFGDSREIDFLSPEDILSAARTRKWLILTAENPCPTSSFWPNSPYLRLPSPDDQSPTPDFGPFIRIVIPPQRHTGRGILSVSGNEFPGIPGFFSNTVIVKSANQPLILKRLQKKYRIYVHLAAAGVTCIPDVVGFFKHANAEGNLHAELDYSSLVLEDVGTTSIADVSRQRGNIPREYVIECLQALEQIHDANYCYGEISLCHIMIRARKARRRDRPRICFVGFGSAFRTKKEWRKEKEFQTLIQCLQNPLKRRLDDESWANSQDNNSET